MPTTSSTTTANRVAANTAEEINRRIRRATEARVRALAADPSGIERRLDELEEEWDIERVLETNASALAFAGLALGTSVDRKWLALPALVAAFLFQHAVQGWCPPIPILRRFGVRTVREIDDERTALKALRGDFATLVPDDADPAARAERALQAVRR
jgi:hypothetical protein